MNKLFSILIFSLFSFAAKSFKPIILFDVNALNTINSKESLYYNTMQFSKLDETSKFLYYPSFVKNINKWNNQADLILFPPYNISHHSIGLDNFNIVEEDLQSLTKATIANKIINKIDKEKLVFLIDNDLELFDDYKIMKELYKRPNTVFICPRDGLTKYHIDLVDKYLLNPKLHNGMVTKEFKTWSWSGFINKY